MAKQEKIKTIEEFRKQLDKDYGKGTVFTGGGSIQNIERWSLSSLVLSDILGEGLPKGRVIEIFGPESGGKSSIATYFCAEVQKQGGRVAYIDVEHAIDPAYMQTFGLDVDSVEFSQPNSGEQALSIVEDMVKSGLFDIIVIDSVDALTPQSVIDGNMSDSHMGVLARLMGQALRKLNGIAAESQTTLVFVNQIREKIGCVSPDTVITWC